MKSLHIIINPVSGNGRAVKVWNRLKQRLDSLDFPYHAYETTFPGEASELTLRCIREHAEVILSIGGDGTAFEIAQNLLGTDIPLGIIPAGTGNDFVKSLRLPKDPVEILDFILGSEPSYVDIGRINEKLFINACGIGFDVSVLDYSTGAKKYFKGMLPYLWGVLRTIAHYVPTDISLSVDGMHVLSREILVCSVANGIYIGGGMPISPESRVDDGFLDVVVVENVTRMQMIRYLPGLLTGKILTFKDTKSFRGKSISIKSSGSMRLNIDGEVLPFNSAEFRIISGGLRVFCRL